MSELMGGDETLFSLWPEQYLSPHVKPAGLDWVLKDQQVVPVPIMLLDDGRFAFQSDGQLCLLNGLQGVGEGEDVFLPTPTPLDDPSVELPSLSDATIKSMLVQGDLESELSLVGPGISELPPSPVDDEFKALVSFRCQYCDFSSADVPSLMEHSKTEHVQPEVDDEESNDSAEAMDDSLPSEDPVLEAAEDVPNIVEQFVYLCSECKGGFTSVDECRDHMIKDHNMVLDDVKKEDKRVEAEVVEVEVPQPSPAPPAPIPIKPTKASSKPREYDPDFEAKPHKCPEAFCVHKFRSLTCLEQHIECHSQDDSRRFCCSHCSMLFLKWGQCAAHLWKEHKLDLDLWTCSVCEYKTTTRVKMVSHARIHSEERPYKCPVCSKGFKQRTQLINHKASVHNKDKGSAPKWYMAQQCEVCFKTYSDSKCLKKHMQAVHSKLKPYKCHICGHMSARKAMLQAHMRQHTGEKPFACQLCPFKTGDHNSLRRHVMRHTGKRPYSCPHCPYSSIQSSSFKSHLQSRHPGKAGFFTCDKCNFATVSEQSFNKHMNDHKLNLIPPAEVEMFPENVAVAHLVYRSFGASPSRLRCDVTSSSTSRDGMKQTIQISIPSVESGGTDDEDTAHCFLPGDELDTGGITIPAEPEPALICFD